MDDFLHNLRSGKLKQADRSNRSYNDPQYKGSQRRNSMDRRKKEIDAFERLNAVKEVLESISETQKRMARAYEARYKFRGPDKSRRAQSQGNGSSGPKFVPDVEPASPGCPKALRSGKCGANMCPR